MTTSPIPAAARPVGVAVAPITIAAIKQGVEAANSSAEARAALKQTMASVLRIANGADNGRASGPAVSPTQAPLNDIRFDGPEGATVAWRQCRGENGPVREFVGVGENDAAAGQQAAAALGRTPGVAVPGLEAYGAGSAPAATVDDRTAVLENQKVQSGLSAGSPMQQTDKGAAAGKGHTGARVQSPQQTQPDRTR